MTIYLERENIKVPCPIGPVGKRGCLPTFMVHLSLMGMGVALPPCCDPQLTCGTFGPSALIVFIVVINVTISTFGTLY